MAQMERNTNLEEIENSGFLGMEQFKYQTMAQKVVFFSTVAISIGAFLVITFVFHKNPTIALFIFCPLMIAGTLFSSNFNQDLTMVKYLMLRIKKPITMVPVMSSEDPEYLKLMADEVKRESEKANESDNIEETKKKALRTLLTMGVVFVIIIVVVIIIAAATKNQTPNTIHHTVGALHEIGEYLV